MSVYDLSSGSIRSGCWSDINENPYTNVIITDTATWLCQVKECKIILGAKSANWLAN